MHEILQNTGVDNHVVVGSCYFILPRFRNVPMLSLASRRDKAFYHKHLMSLASIEYAN